MEIGSFQIRTDADGVHALSATVDGQEIGYRITGTPNELRRSYDPFVLASWVRAMEKGEDIHVAGDFPVSGVLLTNLERAMVVYDQWYPRVRPVEIVAEQVDPATPLGSDHVGVFFSGGVDSLYSFIRNEHRVTHLILCQGLDIPANEPERWRRTVDHVAGFARDRKKELVLVETDAKENLRPPGRTDNHGAILVSTGLALGFIKLLVPGSHSMTDLFPWGSHPLLDPFFSNGVTEVVHDSPIPRSKKTQVIAETGIGLDALRICNVQTEYNCGHCEKCLRTRTALALLGASAECLEPLLDPKELRSVTVYSESQQSFWADNLDLAVAVGRTDFQREIERITRSFRVRRALKQLDADLLGGWAFRLKHRLRGKR